MADILPLAEIVHTIPGRARLRIAARRGDGVFFASVATGLSAIAGVWHVEVRPLTASIVVQHGAPLARIGAAAEQARLFVLADMSSAPRPTPAIRIDPKMIAAVGMGIAALGQLATGRIFPPATTLAWYAASLAGLLPHGDSGESPE